LVCLQYRPEDVTPEDIVALTNAGAEAGVVARQERQIDR
jgi:hypothetical protein